MALCINLRLGRKHLWLYQIPLLQDIFCEKMPFLMTRYNLTSCFIFVWYLVQSIVWAVVYVNQIYTPMIFVNLSMNLKRIKGKEIGMLFWLIWLLIEPGVQCTVNFPSINLCSQHEPENIEWISFEEYASTLGFMSSKTVQHLKVQLLFPATKL
jgi:hypothetical protein